MTVAASIDARTLREIALRAGADDVGFVRVGRPEVDPDRKDIETFAPWTKTLVSYVVRLNREPIRTPARSIANREFHMGGDDVDRIGHDIVRELEASGHRAVNPSMGFPMEMDRFPGKIWVISHKHVAEAAGLGKMGIHRNLIHPKFGNFVLLGTILTDLEVDEENSPIDYNPCVECKLCVAACPVGAIRPDGGFNFASCYTHNYREFMGGFTTWVEDIADSPNRFEYRKRTTDAESASMWQSLSYGANYKAAYCMAVCPAGDDVMGNYRADKPGHLKEIVKPLQKKEETVYVVAESDAEDHARKRYPHKARKRVRSGLLPTSVEGFLAGMPLTFNPGKAAGFDRTVHFSFSGGEAREATVEIRDRKLRVREGIHGSADLAVRADAATWIGFLREEKSILWALLTRKVRVKGSLGDLVRFGKCFPS